MFILVDNYDSFTWNLWHFLSDLGAEVKTIRNDEYTADEFIEMAPQGFIISPGPGSPEDAGVILDLIEKASGSIPIFGVCLGMQAICMAHGGTLMRVDPPVHGKLSLITHAGTGIFDGVEQNIPVTRYHSLCAVPDQLPDCLEVTARTADGLIMGVSHTSHHVHGVQFHPESIASVGGYRMLANFLAKCGHNILKLRQLPLLKAKLSALIKNSLSKLHKFIRVSYVS